MAIRNGQSRETGNIEHTLRRQTLYHMCRIPPHPHKHKTQTNVVIDTCSYYLLASLSRDLSFLCSVIATKRQRIPKGQQKLDNLAIFLYCKQDYQPQYITPNLQSF